MRSKINGRHPANHRIRQNGARIHETISGRSDSSAENRYAPNLIKSPRWDLVTWAPLRQSQASGVSFLFHLDVATTGSFELAIIRMSRYYDLVQNAVLFGDTLLPAGAFHTPDSVETKLVDSVFRFAKELAELKLSEIQLALYSAFVLLSHGTSSSIR